jgi:hypothetical protein
VDLLVDANVSVEDNTSMFRAEDRASMFIRDVGIYLHVQMALQDIRTSANTYLGLLYLFNRMQNRSQPVSIQIK